MSNGRSNVRSLRPRVQPAVGAAALGVLCFFAASSSATDAVPVMAVGEPISLTVDGHVRKAISPYVYGINRFPGAAQPQRMFTLDRAGGNRWTAYNWETNASNAGSDYNFQNDDYFGGGAPAETVRRYIEADQKEKIASLITVQLQGFVAADTSGPVSIASAIDAKRFKEVVFEKKSLSAEPFTETPSTTDPYVYMDEFLWAVDRKFPHRDIFGSNPKAAPVFVSLDNEPELWSNTHKEIQGTTLVPADLYIHRSLRLAGALKAQFPNVVIFAPAHYGFYGIYGWQGGVKATTEGPDWFVDRYARAVQTASKAAGHLLIDVYDIHCYTEATDSTGHRVTQFAGATLSDDQVQALVQSPRSLSDPGYVERSSTTMVAASILPEQLPRQRRSEYSDRAACSPHAFGRWAITSRTSSLGFGPFETTTATARILATSVSQLSRPTWKKYPSMRVPTASTQREQCS